MILFSILYQILFLLVSETHENDGQGAGDEQEYERAVPAERTLGDVPHHHVRQDGGAEEVAEEPGQPGRRAGGVFRCQVEGLHADQHHGTVDEEPDGDQGERDDHVVIRELPVEEDEERHESHEYDRRDRPASLEHHVAEPAANEGSRDRGELVSEVSPPGFFNIVPLRLLQVGRGPVQATVAHHVNEGVGDGDKPQHLVVQHVLEENLPRGEHLFLLLAVILGVIVPPSLYRRQPAGLRRVADQHVRDQGHEQGHGRRENVGSYDEVPGTVRAVEPRPEPHGTVHGHRAHQGATHVVGAVPDGHLRPPFLHGEPVSHHPAAGRPPHAVKPTDQEVQHGHDHDGRRARPE